MIVTSLPARRDKFLAIQNLVVQMPDGTNNCLTGVPKVCYYPCEIDSDCPQGTLCTGETTCLSGDAIMLKKSCK